MAIIREFDQKSFDEWTETLPDVIQKLCKQFPPNRLYLLKTSGHRVTLYSYNEDNTLTVNVTGEYNNLTFERQVFGIKPEDLEECDLPKKDEVLGALLTEKNDIEEYIDKIRPSILSE